MTFPLLPRLSHCLNISISLWFYLDPMAKFLKSTKNSNCYYSGNLVQAYISNSHLSFSSIAIFFFFFVTEDGWKTECFYFQNAKMLKAWKKLMWIRKIINEHPKDLSTGLRTYRHICMCVNLHMCVHICIHAYHILMHVYIWSYIYIWAYICISYTNLVTENSEDD